MRAHRFARVALVVSSLAAIAASHQHFEVPTRAEQGSLFVPRPEVARASALGFDAVLADYYWLRAVQIVGSDTVPEAHADVLGQLIDVTTTLDPWVGHPYRFAAVWLTSERKHVEKANMLLERSFPYHPEEWRNRFYLGFNHFYYLGDHDTAADYLELASKLEGSPTYLGRLVARLRAGSAGLDVAEGWLVELAKNAADGRTRAEYEKAIDEVRTERIVRFLDAARESYKERNGRDIEKVEDLVDPSDPRALAELPPELHGWEWVIDEDSGRIVSSYYMRRYEPTIM